MKRIAFIGSSDLAQYIHNYLKLEAAYTVTGFYDDFQPKGKIVEGLPVLGNLNDIEPDFKAGHFDAVMNGIGYNHLLFRQEIFEKLSPVIPFETYIHPTCFVHPSAKIGAGVFAMPGCIFDSDVVIHDNIFFNMGCLIGHHAEIKNNCFFASDIKMGGYSSIGGNSFIGIGSIIVSNFSVGKNISLGAGTIVTKNLTEPGLYVGVPPRKIK